MITYGNKMILMWELGRCKAVQLCWLPSLGFFSDWEDCAFHNIGIAQFSFLDFFSQFTPSFPSLLFFIFSSYFFILNLALAKNKIKSPFKNRFTFYLK